MAEVQKNQALTESEVQEAQAKSQMEIQRMQMASQIKQQEMEIQFGYDLQLAEVQLGAVKQKEQYIEDRKDRRAKVQATQQSEMIAQRKNNSVPVNFETGDQALEGLGIEAFTPN